MCPPQPPGPLHDEVCPLAVRAALAALTLTCATALMAQDTPDRTRTTGRPADRPITRSSGRPNDWASTRESVRRTESRAERPLPLGRRERPGALRRCARAARWAPPRAHNSASTHAPRRHVAPGTGWAAPTCSRSTSRRLRGPTCHWGVAGAARPRNARARMPRAKLAPSARESPARMPAALRAPHVSAHRPLADIDARRAWARPARAREAPARMRAPVARSAPPALGVRARCPRAVRPRFVSTRLERRSRASIRAARLSPRGPRQGRPARAHRACAARGGVPGEGRLHRRGRRRHRGRGERELLRQGAAGAQRAETAGPGWCQADVQVPNWSDVPRAVERRVGGLGLLPKRPQIPHRSTPNRNPDRPQVDPKSTPDQPKIPSHPPSQSQLHIRSTCSRSTPISTSGRYLRPAASKI